MSSELESFLARHSSFLESLGDDDLKRLVTELRDLMERRRNGLEKRK